MPKQLEYPRASFKNALSLADAVNTLGGDCNTNTCADKLNYKGGNKNGAFNALVGAAVKHGLVTSKSETLTATELYSKIKLSYTETESQEYMQSAFLTPLLYRKIYDKFKGKELPIDILERMLIREYEVDKSMSSRVTGYITEGAKFVGLLVENRFIENIKAQDVEVVGHQDELKAINNNEDERVVVYQDITPVQQQPQNSKEFDGEGYVLKVIGPDMNSTYKVQDEDDFIIIEAILRKLKKRLGVT
jgi:hypothetical protein